MAETDDEFYDLIILGGGLAGALIALALAEQRPNLKLLLVEPGEMLGGNHIWSFFESDIAPANRWLIAPMIAKNWPHYRVRFPGHSRQIDQPYCAITSAQLDAVVRAKLSAEQILRAEVTAVAPARPPGNDVLRQRWRYHYQVDVSDGRALQTWQVIDVRGAGDLTTLKLGYQKFMGQMLSVPSGHGLAAPIIMDATVDQAEGYRFVYCLPFSATEVFVEDTYYTNGPALDTAALARRIGDYAQSMGWDYTLAERSETGVLPVVYGGDFAAYYASTGADIAKAGVRAGLFHAMTGYSLPDAVRFAAALPAILDKHPQGIAFAQTLELRAARHWRRQAYYRLLGKMLFQAAAPSQRFRIFERFYKLDEGLIARFYAGESTMADQARILMGRPPVPLFRALEALIRG